MNPSKPVSREQKVSPQLAEELADAKNQLLSIFSHFGDIYFWDLGRKTIIIALVAMLTNFLVCINAYFIVWVSPDTLTLNKNLAIAATDFTGMCTLYYLVMAILAKFSLAFPNLQKVMLSVVLLSLVFSLSIFSSMIGFFDSLTWFIFFLYTTLGFVLLDWRQVVITDTGIILMMILISLFPENAPYPVQAYLFSDVNTLSNMSFLDLLSAWVLTAGAAFSGVWIMSFLLRNWHVQGIEHLSQKHFDSLTKLLKRRFILDALAEEASSASREGTHLTVAIIDLDKFKQINTQYGHVFGDQILVHFAQYLQQITRHEDLVGRYGGQEFIVVFPHCVSDNAIEVLERLRDNLKTSPLLHKNEENNLKDKVESTDQGRVVVEFSAGICELRLGDQKAENIIARADRALGKAKSLGGSRILLDGRA